MWGSVVDVGIRMSPVYVKEAGAFGLHEDQGQYGSYEMTHQFQTCLLRPLSNIEAAMSL